MNIVLSTLKVIEIHQYSCIYPKTWNLHNVHQKSVDPAVNAGPLR